MLNYPAIVDYSNIITIEPGKRSGKPCIRGLRITVQDVFEYLAGGMAPYSAAASASAFRCSTKSNLTS
jgi:uncharacterized protein (DUF433 family)